MGGVNIWYSIICGYAHLWYLPMLFWCFILTWLIFKINIREEIKIAGLYILSITAVLPPPLQLNETVHYMPFFYLGVHLYKRQLNIVGIKNALLYALIFAVFLIGVSYYRQTHSVLLNWQKILFWYLKQMYATFGTLFLFHICKLISKHCDSSPKLLQINACCFGIYVIHQFVLMLLYYHSPLPKWGGTYLLPWCGSIVAFFVSLGLTWLLRKYKFGRFLLG